MARDFDNNQDRSAPQRRQFFRRRKSCPFTGEGAMIDYKDEKRCLSLYPNAAR